MDVSVVWCHGTFMQVLDRPNLSEEVQNGAIFLAWYETRPV